LTSLVSSCLKFSLGFCFSPVTFTLISSPFIYRSFYCLILTFPGIPVRSHCEII
jgi:hypothetical protein